MGKFKMPSFVQGVLKFATEHSPEILTGMGIAGMATTAVLVGTATPKAMRLIDEELENREIDRKNGVDEKFAPTEISKSDALKLCWKCYIPAAITFVASTACLIGASSVHLQRNAALVAAYKLSETALTEYREKVIETVGEKKEQIVREKVAQERLDKTPIANKEILIVGDGECICYDYISKRYFKSSESKLKEIENNLNKRMLHDICGSASLNDFYNEIGSPDLDPVEYGYDIGWNTEHLIDLDIYGGKTSDGRPCLVVGHRAAPKYNYC